MNNKVLVTVTGFLVLFTLLGTASAWNPAANPAGASIGLHNLVPGDDRFAPKQNIDWLTWSRQSLFNESGINISYKNPQTSGIYNAVSGTKGTPLSVLNSQAAAYPRTQFEGLDIIPLPRENI